MTRSHRWHGRPRRDTLRPRCTGALVALLLAAPSLADGNNPLDWLAGCWSTPDGNSVEVWRTDGDDLVGFAVTVDTGSVSFYETLSIRKKNDEYVYTAWPSKQREASFEAETIEPNAARFTNAAHDYPQVIEYRRDGNALIAKISMLDGSRPQRFGKIRCEDVED